MALVKTSSRFGKWGEMSVLSQAGRGCLEPWLSWGLYNQAIVAYLRSLWQLSCGKTVHALRPWDKMH